MKVHLTRVDSDFHFEAENENKQKVQIDGSPQIGGHNQGARPMEMLLMGLGGCSGIDVVNILRKQRQEPEDIQITIDGERDADNTPSLFTYINVRFMLSGNLDPQKVYKAVQLSMEKYCSVAKTLENTASISYSVAVNDEEITSGSE